MGSTSTDRASRVLPIRFKGARDHGGIVMPRRFFALLVLLAVGLSAPAQERLPAFAQADPSCCEVPACPASCCDCPHVWARAEYLSWWVQGMKVPPLVTAGTAPTSILFGETRI